MHLQLRAKRLLGDMRLSLSSRSGPGALADKVTKLGKGASAAIVEEAANLLPLVRSGSGGRSRANPVDPPQGSPDEVMIMTGQERGPIGL